jgi:hypothetical protein
VILAARQNENLNTQFEWFASDVPKDGRAFLV